MSRWVEEKEPHGQGSSDSEEKNMPVGSLVNKSPWGRVAAVTSRTRTTAVDVVVVGARATDVQSRTFTRKRLPPPACEFGET